MIQSIWKTKDPVKFTLVGLKGEKIEGSYVKEDLVPSPHKPTDKDYWLLKPVQKFPERTVNGQTQVLVKFLFYPRAYDEWVLKSDIGPGVLANATIRKKAR